MSEDAQNLPKPIDPSTEGGSPLSPAPVASNAAPNALPPDVTAKMLKQFDEIAKEVKDASKSDEGWSILRDGSAKYQGIRLATKAKDDCPIKSGKASGLTKGLPTDILALLSGIEYYSQVDPSLRVRQDSSRHWPRHEILYAHYRTGVPRSPTETLSTSKVAFTNLTEEKWWRVSRSSIQQEVWFLAGFELTSITLVGISSPRRHPQKKRSSRRVTWKATKDLGATSPSSRASTWRVGYLRGSSTKWAERLASRSCPWGSSCWRSPKEKSNWLNQTITISNTLLSLVLSLSLFEKECFSFALCLSIVYLIGSVEKRHKESNGNRLTIVLVANSIQLDVTPPRESKQTKKNVQLQAFTYVDEQLRPRSLWS